MSIHRYDSVVLGAGPAGETVAGLLADAGLAVAIVEQHLVAGECSYYACMPSKALLRPQPLLDEARRVPGVSRAGIGPLDAAAILERRDEVIRHGDDSSHVEWLDEKGIRLYRGHGLVIGDREVRIGESVLIGERAVIVATGSAASVPPVEGLAELDIWNNRQATTADQVPDSLIVLGGGPVGCELAQAWASLGSRVTLIESAPRLLLKEEPFAREQVETSLRDRFGIDVRTGAKAVSAAGAGRDGTDGPISLTLEDGETVSATRLLVATGRTPRTEMIGLESVGIESGGYLDTDDGMRVENVDWLFAIGDVNGRDLLTQAGKYQAWVAARTILGDEPPNHAEKAGMPRVTFTDPQVAATGLTLEAAREKGFDAIALDTPTDGTPGASFEGRDTGGTCRLVVERDSGKVLGATFTGYGTAEWIHAATIAVIGGLSMDALRHAVPPFPTRSEIWLRLQEEWDQ
ncbi:MAG: NAD(P)/FAD-dependent oxidoreductase [Actinomycetota bacterium]|nr:NAD(P)/FAD-dependent oxidoreductase [Actinomycetota bacterium]